MIRTDWTLGTVLNYEAVWTRRSGEQVMGTGVMFVIAI